MKDLFKYLKKSGQVKSFVLDLIGSILLILAVVLFVWGIISWTKIKIGESIAIGLAGILILLIQGENEISKEMNKYEPFDVVVYKPTGERGLVKRVTED